MKSFVPSMKVTLQGFVAFGLMLIMSSCGLFTCRPQKQVILVEPMTIEQNSHKYQSYPLQAWNVNNEEVSLVTEGDTVVFNTATVVGTDSIDWLETKLCVVKRKPSSH